MTRIKDVKRVNLETFIEPDGRLVPIELVDGYLPFIPTRLFYVFGVHNQNDRGKHSHYKTKQILICVNGSVTVVCDDGFERKEWALDEPYKALYIPEMIWDEQIYKDENSVLLVLANTVYNHLDYIEDYEEFKRLKNESK